MEQNKRKKATEWSDIFSEWRRSGGSQRGYCRDKGISISAFGYWYRKLERDGVEQSIVKIGTLPGMRRNGVTARAGGVLVELSDRFGSSSTCRVVSSIFINGPSRIFRRRRSRYAPHARDACIVQLHMFCRLM